jgi:hypothetical protein
MEFNDIWNDLCFRINNKNKHTTERDFQTIAETFFEKLGWSQRKHEIITQKTISLGASNSGRPDIIIANNDEEIFVVELKKPNIEITQRNEEQLFSYMRQEKLDFGILFGEKLQLYYELPKVKKNPVKINEFPFEEDLIEGIEFLRLISKNEYSHEKLENYCKENIEKIEEPETQKKEPTIEGDKDIIDFFVDILRSDEYKNKGIKIPEPIPSVRQEYIKKRTGSQINENGYNKPLVAWVTDKMDKHFPQGVIGTGPNRDGRKYLYLFKEDVCRVYLEFTPKDQGSETIEKMNNILEKLEGSNYEKTTPKNKYRTAISERLDLNGNNEYKKEKIKEAINKLLSIEKELLRN